MYLNTDVSKYGYVEINSEIGSKEM